MQKKTKKRKRSRNKNTTLIDFFCGEFSTFWDKFFPKKTPGANFLFFEKNCQKKKKKLKKITETRDNCLQYERMLKILYFHILNIALFG
jgi:hypothetical protein